MEIKKASKKDIKIKMSIDGLSGSGKTLGALMIAKGLVDGAMDKVVLAQTEAGRAQLYVDKFEGLSVLEMKPPFSPDSFIEAMHLCEKSGFKVMVIDSLSDEWAGAGGALDMHSRAAEVVKNSFAAWRNVTPAHEAVFNELLALPIHVIATFKKKSEYVIESVERSGRQVQMPKKVGLQSIAREGTDYKFMLQFDVDLETHKARAIKDNFDLFDGLEPFVITEETGKKLREWCLK